MRSIKHFSLYLGLALLVVTSATLSGYPMFKAWGWLTLLTVFCSFLLSSIIIYAPKNPSPIKQTQRLVFATSLQFIIVLFYLLLLFWKGKSVFRIEAIFLVGVFFCFLMLQLVLFIRAIQKT